MNVMNSSNDERVHLRSHDGIVVHCFQDHASERMQMLSCPGLVGDPECYQGDSPFWHDTLRHPVFNGVQCTLLINPVTAELLLLDSWNRARLTDDQLEALLQDHAQRHRSWASTLAAEMGATARDPNPPDDDADDDDAQDVQTPVAELSGSRPPLDALRG